MIYDARRAQYALSLRTGLTDTMAKRRRQKVSKVRQEVNHVNVTLNSMRGLVEAARVPFTRRLISPAKAMEQVNNLAKKELSYVSKVHNRQRPDDEALSVHVQGRSKANQRQLLQQDLSSQVRKLHSDARRALVCQSRANRREVLFALQKTGKNGHGNRKATWTALSYVSCKKRG